MPAPGIREIPQISPHRVKVQGSHRCPLRAGGIASATMSNAATEQDTAKVLAQTNRTSRRAYPAATALRQCASANARAVIATALMATLALAGFAATRPLATPGAVRIAPTCSETCAPAQTTRAPLDRVTPPHTSQNGARAAIAGRALAERSGLHRSGTEELMRFHPHTSGQLLAPWSRRVTLVVAVSAVLSYLRA
jgi:hypothetical protein